MDIKQKVNTKKPITMQAPTSRSSITAEQADFFAGLVIELETALQNRPESIFCKLPEYGRLIQGAYACGFVCRDIAPNGEYFAPYITQPEKLRAADFKTVRRFVHYMMRCERHADAGGDLGGGCIHEALVSGALNIVARRLQSEHEWRGD